MRCLKRRGWLEVTPAHVNHASTISIILPKFEPPSDGSINSYAQLGPAFQDLDQRDLSVKMVQDSIQWILELPAIVAHMT